MLYSCQRGIAEVVYQDSSSALIKNTLLVPKLSVNLVSIKRLCRNRLMGSFNDKNIYFNNSYKVVISAKQKEGLYVIKYISKSY